MPVGGHVQLREIRTLWHVTCRAPRCRYFCGMCKYTNPYRYDRQSCELHGGCFYTAASATRYRKSAHGEINDACIRSVHQLNDDAMATQRGFRPQMPVGKLKAPAAFGQQPEPTLRGGGMIQDELTEGVTDDGQTLCDL